VLKVKTTNGVELGALVGRTMRKGNKQNQILLRLSGFRVYHSLEEEETFVRSFCCNLEYSHMQTLPSSKNEQANSDTLSYDSFKAALAATFNTPINWNLAPLVGKNSTLQCLYTSMVLMCLVDYEKDRAITYYHFRLFVRMFGWDASTLPKVWFPFTLS